MRQCRSRRIISHKCLGAEQGLTDGSVRPGQEWAEDMGTGESPLGPTQMCTLCVNGTELQLPRLCDGDNCGTQAQGSPNFGQNLSPVPGTQKCLVNGVCVWEGRGAF